MAAGRVGYRCQDQLHVRAIQSRQDIGENNRRFSTEGRCKQQEPPFPTGIPTGLHMLWDRFKVDPRTLEVALIRG